MGGQPPFHAEIRERYTPGVVVLSDAGVQQTCRESGLSFVDILRACSVDASVGPQGALPRSRYSLSKARGANKCACVEQLRARA